MLRSHIAALLLLVILPTVSLFSSPANQVVPSRWDVTLAHSKGGEQQAEESVERWVVEAQALPTVAGLLALFIDNPFLTSASGFSIERRLSSHFSLSLLLMSQTEPGLQGHLLLGSQPGVIYFPTGNAPSGWHFFARPFGFSLILRSETVTPVAELTPFLGTGYRWILSSGITITPQIQFLLLFFMDDWSGVPILPVPELGVGYAW